MTKRRKLLVLSAATFVLVAAVPWLYPYESAQPFRLRFLNLTNDAANGAVVVFEIEHDLPYNIAGVGGWFQRQGWGGLSNRYYGAREGMLQLPPGQSTRFQVPLPPEAGTWRYYLEMGLPENPPLKAQRPLKVKIADEICSVVSWLPLPASCKSRCDNWSRRTREAWSQPFEIPPPR